MDLGVRLYLELSQGKLHPIERMGMSFQFGDLQDFMIYVQTKANGLSATKEGTLIDSQKAQPRHELVGRP